MSDILDNNTVVDESGFNAEPLLKVEHLCQYFKLGQGTLKAVNDVNFEIKKGEVFGLVGESGCGKTTTGRSIIKLYNCTSGDVYFKGRRICAGTLSYKNTKAEAFKPVVADLKYFGNEAWLKVKKTFKKKTAETVKTVEDSAESAAKPDIKADIKHYIDVAKVENVKIRAAKHDQKNSDKMYAKEQVQKVKSEYLPKLELLDKKGEAYKNLNKEYHEKRRLASKDRLITKIQMVFQDPIASLDPRMTVREIISEGLIIRGVRNKAEIDRQVYEVLDKVGLVREHAGRYPHEFSGGQRQRIGVARAIIMQPEIIIADEPVSALDVSIQAQVINLLNDLRHEMGLTILFIAHDLSVVKYFSDRIAVMYFGNMVELATADELFKHPLHPYTKSLLSAIPLPDPIYEKTRKRIVYNPLADHDYSVDKPIFQEVSPGHFASCNKAELEMYREQVGYAPED